ncbi:MAG: TonB family protein [Bacteroidales bacterium]|nr:TonB family protein [Bacteroidales bacterium]
MDDNKDCIKQNIQTENKAEELKSAKLKDKKEALIKAALLRKMQEEKAKAKKEQISKSKEVESTQQKAEQESKAKFAALGDIIDSVQHHAEALESESKQSANQQSKEVSQQIPASNKPRYAESQPSGVSTPKRGKSSKTLKIIVIILAILFFHIIAVIGISVIITSEFTEDYIEETYFEEDNYDEDEYIENLYYEEDLHGDEDDIEYNEIDEQDILSPNNTEIFDDNSDVDGFPKQILYTEESRVEQNISGAKQIISNTDIELSGSRGGESEYEEYLRMRAKAEAEEEMEDDELYDVAEQMPCFPGGQRALLQYISDNIKYPEVAQEKGIQGRVVLRFIVEKDGSIGEVQILRGVDTVLDQEAIRVVKSLPRFVPGKQNDKAVRAWFTLPVAFKLM